MDSSYAIFWVEVQDNLTSNQSIYVYYGNAGASSVSSGANTFLFFEDWSGSLDWVNKWQSTNQSLYSIVSGKCRCNATATTSELLLTKNAYGAGYASRTMFRCSVAATQFYQDNPDTTWRGKETNYLTWNQSRIYAQIAGINNFVAETPNLSSYYASKFWIPSSGNGTATVYLNGSSKVTKTGAPTYTTSRIGYLSYLTGAIGYIGDTYVRKYVSPEPSHGAWGSEESAPVISGAVFGVGKTNLVLTL